MSEFTKAPKHIGFNQSGLPVVAGTNISILQIGIAHKKGVTDAWLLEQYAMTQEQLEAALAYFQENREALRDYEDKTKQIIPSSSQREAFEALRKKKSSENPDS